MLDNKVSYSRNGNVTEKHQKTAIITGASRGFGAAIAKLLAKTDINLVLIAKSKKRLEKIDDDIKDISGKSATLLPIDLRDEEKYPMLAQAIYERFGKCDILIGNAAVFGGYHPIGHIKIKDWQDVMQVNVTANLHLLQNLTPLLKLSPNGRVVMISSHGATYPMSFACAYSASKAALENMTKCYAQEISNITNIKANIFTPPMMDTDMVRAAHPGGDYANMAQCDDIAPQILPLLADDCAYHGEVIAAK